MLTTIYLYEEIQLENLIEGLTVQCYQEHGDEFLESLIPFFENDDMALMESYYDNQLSLLYEERKKSEGEEEVSRNLKKSLNYYGKSKPGTLRKISSRLYKNKLGRAIVKGVRKAAYGTKLGRKVMKKYAGFKARQAEKQHTKSAMNYTKAVSHADREKGARRAAQAYAKAGDQKAAKIMDAYADTRKIGKIFRAGMATQHGIKSRRAFRSGKVATRNLKMTKSYGSAQAKGQKKKRLKKMK